MEDRAAGDLVGDVHGRSRRRLLVLLLVVLPRHAHGDEGPHAGRAQEGLRRHSTRVAVYLRMASRRRSSPPEPPVFASAETLKAAAGPAAAGGAGPGAGRRRRRTGAGEITTGAIRIDRRVVLTGRARRGASIGGGAGSVVTVTAPDVTMRGLTIRGSGRDLQAMDSGVFLEKTAERALVEDNRIEGNLFGIYIHGAAGSRVERNIVEGMRGGRLNEAGNGVSLWNAPDVTIADNNFRYGRDGIFTISSRKDRVRQQPLRARAVCGPLHVHQRQRSQRQHLGRQPWRLRHHVFQPPGDPRQYLGPRPRLRPAVQLRQLCRDRRQLGGGRFARQHRRRSGTKARTKIAAWCRNPSLRRRRFAADPRNASSSTTPTTTRFRDNWFERCGIGVHFTAGSEGNEITGNAFVGNRNQVKYVGTRDLDWSKGGRGNYWSDNPAFDLNGDGIADTAYRPNDLVDQVLWTAPQAKVLINSPAVQVLRWAQAQFPGALSRRGRRQPSADRAATETISRPEPAMTATVYRRRRREKLSARCGRCATSRSSSVRAGSARWSATTAPARPR